MLPSENSALAVPSKTNSDRAPLLLRVTRLYYGQGLNVSQKLELEGGLDGR